MGNSLHNEEIFRKRQRDADATHVVPDCMCNRFLLKRQRAKGNINIDPARFMADQKNPGLARIRLRHRRGEGQSQTALPWPEKLPMRFRVVFSNC